MVTVETIADPASMNDSLHVQTSEPLAVHGVIGRTASVISSTYHSSSNLTEPLLLSPRQEIRPNIFEGTNSSCRDPLRDVTLHEAPGSADADMAGAPG